MAPPSALDEFRSRYSVRLPERTPTGLEGFALTAAHGLRMLGPVPAQDVVFGKPPSSWNGACENRYLWVIDASGVPHVLEFPMQVVGGALPKHTNLTGGGTAYLGGELWFESAAKIYLSGGSGRYPPTSETQLDDAVCVFKEFGYTAVSLGWDHDTGKARRYLERLA